MEVKFEISNEKIEELLNKEFNGISDEDLKNVILEGFRQYVSKEENMHKILTHETQNYYGTSHKFYDIVVKAADKVDLSPIFEEIRDKMIDMMKTNMQEIINKIFMQMFINSFSSYFYNNDGLRQVIQEQISQYEYNKTNQQ